MSTAVISRAILRAPAGPSLKSSVLFRLQLIKRNTTPEFQARRDRFLGLTSQKLYNNHSPATGLSDDVKHKATAIKVY